MKITELTSALTTRQVQELKDLFNRPIPLDQAIETFRPYVYDQDLSAIIDNELQVKGNGDARDLVAGWLKQNLPDLFRDHGEPIEAYMSAISSHPYIKGE